VIEDVQRRLLSPVVDGVFTPDLVSRVRGFQWVHGLNVSGHLDEATLAKLKGAEE
jgi:peptidoglycan hydrolase-like protein with peptidoglycan-binding domain